MAVELAPAYRDQKVHEGGAPVSLEVVGNLLAGLNRAQRSAVTHRDGPQLVIAGPGTGKTEVVTRRIAWLIATGRARPRDILALTFTDNAADEMQERVDLLLPYGQADAHIHTFHAFGDRLVREHAFELGLAGDVRLVNRAEAVVLLRDHLFELGLDRYRPLGDPTRFLEALVDLFSRAKDEGVSPQTLAEHAASLTSRAGDDATVADLAASRTELAAAYARYQALMAQNSLIDHGDQLALALRLLHERPAVRAHLTGSYRYLLVDEFQDMNRAQLEMVFALTNPSRNVTVVGDPDQAIYTFRGAATDVFERFTDIHPDSRRVVLRTNYRSRRPVIHAARRLMDHSAKSRHWRSETTPIVQRRARSAAPVRLLSFATPDEEADGVAAEVARRVSAGEHPRDFAILTRSNFELGPIVRSLTLRGVPLRSHAKSDFYARASVRPLLALLRVVADPSQTVELYVLATAWPYELAGEALTSLLVQARRSHRSLWQIVSDLADGSAAGVDAGFVSGVRRLVSDVRAAIELTHERGAGEVLYDHLRRSGRMARLATDGEVADANAVARFFGIVRSRAALLADPRVSSLVPHLDALIEAEDDLADTGPLDADAVSVLTVHRVKGLEFRVVFVTGLSEGRFPARGRTSGLELPWHEIRGDGELRTDERLDEERRLCFVAMTRARDELWLSHHSSGPGGNGSRRPSPFIAEALDLPVATKLVTAGLVEQMAIPAPTPATTGRTRAPTSLGRPTFSFSQLEDYIDCAERYRLRHVVGLPTPPHHALSYGRALHEAVAFLHLESARGQPPSESALLAAFERAWRPEGFLSREHEEARYAAGREALRRFRAQQLADPAPVVAVERPFDFDLDGFRIRGRMDRIDEGPSGTVIVDYKSSNVSDQRRANERARDSLQLQVYALAQEAATGAAPSEMQLHFLDSGVVGRTRPDSGRLDRARDKVRSAVEGIANGAFPAKPNPISCGYCPFRQVCTASAA